MVQITTIDTNESSSGAEFTPMRGLSNCHLQTMLPRLFRRQVKFTPYWQRLELPGDDFAGLAWSEDPAQAKHKPCLVMFHGLEGSLNNPYTHDLIEAAQKRGWLDVVMHFRGYGGEPDCMYRIYHSGETEDASWFLHWLQREFDHAPTAAIGYSLGGNILTCPLVKEGNDLPVDAAVIISASFMLEACGYHMRKGLSRVYQRYLLNLLRANTARKLTACPGALPVNLTQLKLARRIREFDDLITARIHGYADAIDCYRQCSVMPMLNRVARPTLVIHAKDNPFMDHRVVPKPESLPPQVEYQLTEHGGHAGLIGGTLLRP